MANKFQLTSNANKTGFVAPVNKTTYGQDGRKKLNQTVAVMTAKYPIRHFCPVCANYYNVDLIGDNVVQRRAITIDIDTWNMIKESAINGALHCSETSVKELFEKVEHSILINQNNGVKE